MNEIVFAPFLPAWLLIGFGAVALLAVGIGLIRGARGWAFRALFFSTLLAALANPQIVDIESEPLDDIVVLAVDRTASARLAGRGESIERARTELRQKLEGFGGVVVEEFEFEDDRNEGSTLLPACANGSPTSTGRGWVRSSHSPTASCTMCHPTRAGSTFRHPSTRCSRANRTRSTASWRLFARRLLASLENLSPSCSASTIFPRAMRTGLSG
ncbi:MAG: hypothetical protein R3C97_09930 [Geminicoccaceae bacterium]